MFIKVVVSQVAPLTLVAGRVAIATLAMTPFVFVLNKRVRVAIGGKPLAWLFVLSVFNTTLPFYFISWGEVHLTSSLAAVLNASNPIFVMILARFALAEKMNATKILGILLGFVGILILMDFSFANLFTTNFLAQIAVLGAALCYAIAAIIVKKHLQIVNKLVLTFYTMLLSSIILAPLSLVLESPWTLSVTPLALLAWVALGILASSVALVVFFGLLQDAGPTVASLVTYIVPVFSMIFGLVLLNETITTNMIIGLALIFIAVFITERSRVKT